MDPNRPPPPQPEPEKPKPAPSVDALGLKLAKLNGDLRKQFSLADGVNGVVITEVPPTSAAATQGLRPGDLVVAIGRVPVASPEEVQRKAAIAAKNGAKDLLVQVERGGNSRFVALPAAGG